MKKIILSLLLFAACGESEIEFSGHHAYFVFDNSQHLNPVLIGSMNAMSPGIFCRISTAPNNQLAFENNYGQKANSTLNAIDQRRTMQLGVSNSSGIIVGFGNLNNPAIFYAYDAQCPNCYEEVNIPSFQLAINNEGKATCRRCARAYDLNNGGIVSKGEGGAKLFRYRATTTGPSGLLSVNN